MTPSRVLEIGGTRISLVRGDITEQHVDAIVNAANSTLLGGGGVDGAIHRKGGPAILAECRRLRAERFPDGLPAGEAASTTGAQLPVRRVIHTVGPVWHGGGRGEAVTLARAFRNSLDQAKQERLRTVAFPSISTGAYGYPIVQAAPVALGAIAAHVRENAGAFDEIRMVLFSASDYDAYAVALETLEPD